MKKFVTTLVVLAVIGAGLYHLTPSVENIVKTVVHKYGSEVTGTEVNLGGFKLDLMNGKVEISDLTVANPENYSLPHAMSVGKVAVQVDIKSILSDTIVIKNVEIEKPQISYEMLSLKQNNISQLMNNIKKNTASDEKSEPKKEEKKENTESTTKAAKKVIVEHLAVSGGQVNVAAALAGKKAESSVSLPNIEMKDIGKEKSGAKVKEVISNVLNKIFDTAYQAVVKEKLVDLKGAAEESLNSVVESVKEKSGLKNWFGFGK